MRVGWEITLSAFAALPILVRLIAILQRNKQKKQNNVTYVTQANDESHKARYSFLPSSLAFFLKYFLNKKLLLKAVRFSFSKTEL